MTNQDPTPTGVFHAHTSRDGASVSREGLRFTDARRLDSRDPEPIWEVLFEDGTCILAGEPDLTFD